MPNLKWGEVTGRWDMRFITITLSVASSVNMFTSWLSTEGSIQH